MDSNGYVFDEEHFSRCVISSYVHDGEWTPKFISLRPSTLTRPPELGVSGFVFERCGDNAKDYIDARGRTIFKERYWGFVSALSGDIRKCSNEEYNADVLETDATTHHAEIRFYHDGISINGNSLRSAMFNILIEDIQDLFPMIS